MSKVQTRLHLRTKVNSTKLSMWVNDIIDSIKLPFRKEKELFSALYNILGFYPRNIDLYKQALLHKSLGRRNEKGLRPS